MSSSSNNLIFPPLHIVPASAQHKHTIVLLHGLGSSGREFAEEFFKAKNSQEIDFRVRFPAVRWVFPSAPLRFIPIPGETSTRPAWFQIASLMDLEHQQDIQMQGLEESVDYLGNVLNDELLLLERNGSKAEDLFVIARSQGSSAGIWTLLSRMKKKIGGVVLTGSWLVFARTIDQVFNDDQAALTASQEERSDALQQNIAALEFVRSMVSVTSRKADSSNFHPLSQTPIMIGHGVDDQWISIDLGRQMKQTLERLGCQVQWHEYSGAAGEGHWLKEPDEFDHIVKFLEELMAPTLPA